MAMDRSSSIYSMIARNLLIIKWRHQTTSYRSFSIYFDIPEIVLFGIITLVTVFDPAKKNIDQCYSVYPLLSDGLDGTQVGSIFFENRFCTVPNTLKIMRWLETTSAESNLYTEHSSPFSFDLMTGAPDFRQTSLRKGFLRLYGQASIVIPATTPEKKVMSVQAY